MKTNEHTIPKNARWRVFTCGENSESWYLTTDTWAWTIYLDRRKKRWCVEIVSLGGETVLFERLQDTHIYARRLGGMGKRTAMKDARARFREYIRESVE